MDPKVEFPGKEQVVVTPELASRIGEVARGIEEGLNVPEIEVANATGQLSMMAEFGQLARETTAKRVGILFKDTKAVLGILPFLNKVSEWNTARIAKQPVAKMADGIKSPQEIAQDSLKAMENSAMTKVQAAAGRENILVPLEKEMAKRKKDFDKAIAARQQAIATNTGADRATKVFVEKQQAYFEAVKARNAAVSESVKANREAISTLTAVPMPEKPWKSTLLRRVGIHTEGEYKVAHKRITEQAAKKGKSLSDGEIFRLIANGEAPAFSRMDRFGRGAKKVAVHMVLQNMGPIINPVPDVPELVTMGSYAAELFGGQWWAGLIPPLWQFAHNRYEDVKMSYETSQKALEIVKRHWNSKYDKLKEPRVAKAAEAFAV